MRERRIVFGFGVAQDTSPAQAQALAQAVRDIIEAEPQLRFDRAHFKGFGASSLDYEVVYIVKDPGYNLYMDLQQRINLALLGRLQALGMRLAVPVSRVQLADQPAGQEGPSSVTGMPIPQNA